MSASSFVRIFFPFYHRTDLDQILEVLLPMTWETIAPKLSIWLQVPLNVLLQHSLDWRPVFVFLFFTRSFFFVGQSSEKHDTFQLHFIFQRMQEGN